MNDSPGENRVTDDPTGLSCRKGRPGGTLWQASSSPPVSPSERKNVPTDRATLHVTNLKRLNTGESGFVLVPPEVVEIASIGESYSSRDLQLRKPGARESARYVEVGGSGGNGRRQPAAPGPGDGKFFSGCGCGGGAYYMFHLRESNPAKESIGSQRVLGGDSL